MDLGIGDTKVRLKANGLARRFGQGATFSRKANILVERKRGDWGAKRTGLPVKIVAHARGPSTGTCSPARQPSSPNRQSTEPPSSAANALTRLTPRPGRGAKARTPLSPTTQ